MSRKVPNPKAWRTTHGDMSDEEWALIADLVEPYSSRGKMGSCDVSVGALTS